MRLAAALLLAAALSAAQDSPVLKAMRDELERSRALQVLNLEKPYFLSYSIEDAESFTASATLGGLISSRHDRLRVPEVAVRIGDYKFDNTNYIGSGFRFGSSYDIDRYPLEDSYPVLRRFLWLATDSAYKSALESFSRKRAALRNVAEGEALDDFAKAQPVKLIVPVRNTSVDENEWQARVRRLSEIFVRFPAVKASGVDVTYSKGVRYVVNSEGTELQTPENLMFLKVQALAQAPDGMSVRDSIVLHSQDPARMPLEAELLRETSRVAENVTALARAPAGENYNGPVLFEGAAAAQLFAEVLGRNLTPTRRPVMEPGRPGPPPTSELEGRFGARILPEWMTVVDDPTQTEWRGRPLFGHYEVDREGVIPKPLTVVDKGVLKAFLLTRQPVRGFEGSNGRARLPGNFGADKALITNLFVSAGETTPLAELRRKMLDICRQRDKPYGLIVRKMDFPSSASFDEVRRILMQAGQSGSRPVSMPLLVYRLYADGREELVRGLRFRGLNTRSLKDILAAGDDSTVFEYLDNGVPFALIGAGSYVEEACVVAPSVLIDDLEVQKADDELPKLPVVPAPALVAVR